MLALVASSQNKKLYTLFSLFTHHDGVHYMKLSFFVRSHLNVNGCLLGHDGRCCTFDAL